MTGPSLYAGPGRARVAEVMAHGDGGQRRGSGYRVSERAVLTAAHVVDGAEVVMVRFEPDLPGEWTADIVDRWVDTASDLAVLVIAPHPGEQPVPPVSFGRIGVRAAVVAVQAVGFPRWKMRSYDSAGIEDVRFRDAHQVVGSVAVLSNWREGTLEVVVPQPPAGDGGPGSPWEGMSGAALWVGDRVVGVVSAHHPAEGPARLTAVRVDRGLERLDRVRRAALVDLLPALAPEVLLPDVVTVASDELVLSAYRAQLMDIAPAELIGREAELEQLVRFCAGDEPYGWLQAGPWAGKSALLSWFALHPPAGVDVVSFFVTSRFAGQSDSDAFTGAMLEQLAALAGEPPPMLSEARVRRGHMLRLLQIVADRAAAAGRRLLVLVDGLDEDDGGGTADRPSIASTLPRRPPPHARVLVSSRPQPGVPDDVPGDHPLRSVVARPLSESPHARDKELAAKFEIVRVLAGPSVPQDVLGLLTGSGGGLSRTDLEVLSGCPRYTLERLLSGRFGRILQARTSPPRAIDHGESGYVLGHETLRVLAEEQFGSSLDGYRQRLHHWASQYRDLAWPAGTPRYLLRDYPRLLARLGDSRRLVALATDRARHDRLLDITGGDALALEEVSAATALLLASDPVPDLAALLVLAATRDDLAERNAGMPSDLPAVWAIIGFPDRAAALANGLTDLGARARAITATIPATAKHSRSRAAALARTAERLVRALPDPVKRAVATAELVSALAAAGDTGRATRLARELVDPSALATALSGLLPVIAAEEERDDVIQLVATAERLVLSIRDPAARAEALARLADTLSTADRDPGTVQRLVSHAVDATRSVRNTDRRAQALCRVVGAVALSGDVDQAERLARRIEDSGWRSQALAGLAQAVAAQGGRERALDLIDDIADESWRAEAVTGLVVALARAGDHDRAERLARQIDDPAWQAQAMLGVLRALAEDGTNGAGTAPVTATAERLARAVPQAESRHEALAVLAVLVGSSGDVEQVDRAVQLLEDVPNPASRKQSLVQLARHLAAKGATEQATRLAVSAEQLARRTADRRWRSQASLRLVSALSAAGDRSRALEVAGVAERAARALPDALWRAKALTELVMAIAAAGDAERALRLVAAAKEAAAQTPNRVQALTQLVAATAAAGDRSGALRLATEVEALGNEIPNEGWRSQALGQLAVAVAAAGDHERALAIAGAITAAEWRAQALHQLVLGLMSGGVRPTSVPGDERIVRRTLAEAICTPSWTTVLDKVAAVDLEAVRRVADLLCDPAHGEDPDRPS